MQCVDVYLALGSNIGDREQTLAKACDLIRRRVGSVIAESKVYDTAPEGFLSEHRFLNQAIHVQTELNPLELLNVTQEIERSLGRERKSTPGQYHDRTCDIDIILYGPMIWQSEALEIPHPRFRERRFVLQPLVEIAPEAVDPLTGKTIKDLYHGQTRSA